MSVEVSIPWFDVRTKVKYLVEMNFDIKRQTLSAARSGNLHCLAHAIHALLCMADAAGTRADTCQEADADAVGGVAKSMQLHCRFLEVAALVVLRHRQALDPRGQVEVNKERLQASYSTSPLCLLNISHVACSPFHEQSQLAISIAISLALHALACSRPPDLRKHSLAPAFLRLRDRPIEAL